MAEELDQCLASRLDILSQDVDFQPVARGKYDPFGEKSGTVSDGTAEVSEGVGQPRAADGKSFA